MQTNYIVYADVLFMLNFFLDFFLLWAAGCFLRRKIRYWRIIISALLGAFYAVGMVMPELSFFYSFGFKIIFSFFMLFITYGFQSVKKFLSLIGVYYIVAFAMGGAALGASSIMAGAGIHLFREQVVGISSLAFALFIAAIVGKKGYNKLKQSWHKDDFTVKLEIKAAGRICTIPALIDTGNSLMDPVSGKPVIVGEYSLLAELLPHGVKNAISFYGLEDPAKVIANQGDSGWQNRLRLVPFVSIGQKHGLLLGFRPDEIIIHASEKHITDQAIICFYNNQFGEGDNYQAVINPDILYLAEDTKEVSA